MAKMGVYSGSFDPVHAGHVAFALAAAQAVGLDKVYFAPEMHPRRKDGVTHFAHRLAMLRLAVQPHPRLDVLELPDRNFSVAATLPRLRQQFPSDELFYLCGSDMLEHMGNWKLVGGLLQAMTIVVGLRAGATEAAATALLQALPIHPCYVLLPSPEPKVSAAAIREALAAHQPAPGLLDGTQEYIAAHWLYSRPLDVT